MFSQHRAKDKVGVTRGKTLVGVGREGGGEVGREGGRVGVGEGEMEVGREGGREGGGQGGMEGRVSEGGREGEMEGRARGVGGRGGVEGGEQRGGETEWTADDKWRRSLLINATTHVY
jgi:hypothetical protein